MLFIILFSRNLPAIEEETRIPHRVSQVRMKIETTPLYSEAYDGFGKRQPLWGLIIRDSQLKKWVKGTLSRKRMTVEFSWVYGLSTNWILEFSLPIEQTNQSSNLELQIGAPSNNNWTRTLNNLSSETLTGIGDMGIKAGYEMGANTKWFVRGGFDFLLPSGRTGTPRGIYPHSVGERHLSASTFLHMNWYPFVYGLRNVIRFSTITGRASERENLAGENFTYAPGNRLDFHYSWSYERSNFFYGLEFHYLQQLESHLDGGKDNQGYFSEGKLELGWGNLSDLEQKIQEIPWQVSFGQWRPILGEDQPIAPGWQMSFQLFF